MRRAARVDSNQTEIVAALRAAGASVQPIHAVGGGVPDLLVGYRGQNVLLEVKDGGKPLSGRQLTPAEADWFAGWRGRVTVVTSPAEALKAVGAWTE